MANQWIEHVKKYAAKNKVTYGVAMKKAKKTYEKKQRGGNARLANIVYDPNRGSTDEHRLVSGDKRSATFEKDGKAVVALRGTDVRSARDLGNDALIAVGLSKLSPRYRKDKKTVKRAIKKYGKENVTVTGHSLGGKLASEIARDTGVKGATYNKGASVPDFVRGVGDRIACKVNKKGKKCKKAKLVTNYRVKSDPISLLGAVDINTKLVKRKKKTDPHSISNFTGSGKKKKPKRPKRKNAIK